MQGKIKIENLQPAQTIKDLFQNKNMKSKLFLETILSFNMMFLFTFIKLIFFLMFYLLYV